MHACSGSDGGRRGSSAGPAMLAIAGDGSTTGGSSVAVALLTRSGICMVTVASLHDGTARSA